MLKHDWKICPNMFKKLETIKMTSANCFPTWLGGRYLRLNAMRDLILGSVLFILRRGHVHIGCGMLVEFHSSMSLVHNSQQISTRRLCAPMLLKRSLSCNLQLSNFSRS